MLDTLRGSFAAGRIAPHTRERVTAAFRTILESGVKAGTLRADVNAEDATTLLHGVFLATVDGDGPERSHRLLDLIADAVRAPGIGHPDGAPDPG
ncbi:hypothetical protein QRX50_42130 [Amycolatopsis carbonis]|uniref:Transcriptional regulator SbtR-like C-terminal domain-containing protein n=1 Tax=Amycolatopsis carbonis TaxID=715471 RepID=A0A9Y2ICM0_9PSEU|nr:hypothetical protein [Amycolatopsis sp. 2-15]WIX77930.1 hypothetical protein QRX50_42130 [Amycolatopsis sp. 2-15]